MFPISVSAKSYKPPKVKLTTCKQKKSEPNTILLKWKKLKGVSGYQIYYSQKKNKGFKKFYTVKGNSNRVELYQPHVNKSLYYRVRAYKKKGSKNYYGKWSNVKKATIKENAPAIGVGGDLSLSPYLSYPTFQAANKEVFVPLANYSKSRTIYLNIDDVLITNHNKAVMTSFISTISDHYMIEMYNTTDEDVCYKIPPRTVVFIWCAPYLNQIPFKSNKKNVNAFNIGVGYSPSSINDYSFIWLKGTGNHLMK